MRLAVRHGPRQLVKKLPPQLSCVSARIQCRAINTKPRHERPQPVIELLNLRPQPNPRAQSIAVLGGGITGLSSAWHLSRLLPDAKITIYEKQNRLGGWLDSEVIEADGGEVLFEWGPRSLRPDSAGAGRATILLLLQLKLVEDVIGILKTSPASYNRFIYYDGRLVQMPGPNPNLPPFVNIFRNGLKLITEPIFNGVLGSLFAEYWVQSRPQNMTDESVGDFIRRRFGKTAADNLASAFMHGIYAGDLYKLSVRTLLPALWHMETRDPEGAGVIMEMVDLTFKQQGLMPYKHGRYVDLLEAAGDDADASATAFLQSMHQDTSVYTFGKGLQQISQRLQEDLHGNKNVDVCTGTDVKELLFNADTKKIRVCVDGTNEAPEFDYVVSTLPARSLAAFAKASATARGATLNSDTEQALREADKAVNVGVVNLYYSNPYIVPSNYRGFGYLIPRSVSLDQNPERALGVLFGSESSGDRGEDAVRTFKNHEKEYVENMYQMVSSMHKNTKYESEEVEQRQQKMIDDMAKTRERLASEPDEVVRRAGQDTAPGTKLTVMLGGHWWDGWTEEDLPNEEQLVDMAKTLLARHLKITEEPLVAKARLNRDCIPQYHVGYRQRMASVHRGLMEEFKGRLKVAGPWWQGAVGVNDCILNAHLTAFNIREEWDEETGLKEYTEKEKWLILDRRTRTFAIDSN